MVEALLLKPWPVSWIAAVGRGIGGVAYRIAGPYRRLALHNLELALGNETSEAERIGIANEHFKRLGANLLAGFKLALMSEADVTKRVRGEGLERIAQSETDSKSLVSAVCHLSCWEVLTQVPSLLATSRPHGSVFQRLANPLLNDLLWRRRENRGYRLFDRSEGFSEPIKFLRDGGWLGVLVDQHAGDHGIWTPFFGRLASTTPLAALLARRSNAQLLPVFVRSDGLGRWLIRCLPPVKGTGPGERGSIEEVTVELNRIVEQEIRENPADWFWVHNRWKTPHPNFLLSQYRRGVVLPEVEGPEGLKRFELLVRSPNWLGDACMAFPMVRALKRGRPDLRLTVLGPEKLRDLWEAMPEVDAFIGKRAGEGLFSVARRIKGSGVAYDAATLTTHSTRSTLELRLAGVPRLVGYAGSFRRRLLHQVCLEPTKGKPPLHHARRYLAMAESVGADISGSELWALGQPEAETAGGVKVGICAGAEYGPAKRWPLENYAAVANALTQTRTGEPIQWQLFGAPGETEMGEMLSASIDTAHVNRVGKTRLSDLMRELKTCRVLLTNDTGTMHLAAALGVPTVAIFGSTEPSLTGPLGPHHRILRHHVPCSPCFQRQCPFGHYDCMTGVTVPDVVAAVTDVLSECGND